MAKYVRLPKSFELMGHTWQVVQTAEKLSDGDLGHCSQNELTIRIDPNQPAITKSHTFFHELVHAILFALGKEELNSDEGLVDAIGGALDQYHKTKKY